ncbi:MAG: hypothetical protein IPK16_19480 [Anaerolineales bacterium]|nr:hypothetical protein [Anaerolineales bacterium]
MLSAGGVLTLVDSAVERNEAMNGGGIAAGFGTVNVVRSNFTDNWATKIGGGVYNA